MGIESPQVGGDKDEWAESAQKFGGVDTASEGSPASPEVMAEIEEQETLLKGHVTEAQAVMDELESGGDAEQSGEDWWSKWHRVEEEYNKAQLKVAALATTLFGGSAATLIYAAEKLQEQPDLLERAATTGGVMVWASIATFLGGSLYNQIQKKRKMRS